MTGLATKYLICYSLLEKKHWFFSMANPITPHNKVGNNFLIFFFPRLVKWRVNGELNWPWHCILCKSLNYHEKRIPCADISFICHIHARYSILRLHLAPQGHNQLENSNQKKSVLVTQPDDGSRRTSSNPPSSANIGLDTDRAVGRPFTHDRLGIIFNT